MKKIIYIFLLGSLLFSCSDDFETEGDFYQWVNDKENGFVKTQTSNNFLFTVKHLPTPYLAFLELKKSDDNFTEDAYQSLLKEFENGKTFTLTLEHTDNLVDPTYFDVSNIPEYKERIHQLNFNMGEYISLKTADGRKIKPVLASMENIYHLENKKTIYLVFPNTDNSLNETEMIDIVFEDIFFKTGINHFQFYTKDLEQLPQFNFIQNGNK